MKTKAIELIECLKHCGCQPTKHGNEHAADRMRFAEKGKVDGYAYTSIDKRPTYDDVEEKEGYEGNGLHS